MRPVHALPAIAAAAVIGGYLWIGWTGGEPSSDRCDGGVGDGCTVDTRPEPVTFAGNYFGSGRSRKTEWRVYDATGWHRYVGPRSKFEATPGAVLVGDLP